MERIDRAGFYSEIESQESKINIKDGEAENRL